MNDVQLYRNQIDGVLLGWTIAWSIVFVAIVSLSLGGESEASLPDYAHLVLGLAMGGTVATWTLIGTWCVLIHLPQKPRSDDSAEMLQERLGPRMVVLVVILAQCGMLSVLIRNASSIFAQIVLAAVLGIAGSVLVFQWTRQRVHRGMEQPKNRRSIRQMLGVATTIAIALATVKTCASLFGISTHAQIVVALIAFLWLMMLLLGLGAWAPWILMSLPVVGMQWVVISATVDMESRSVEGQLLRSTGVLFGFYLIAFLLIVLMRSSGHRWVGGKPMRV